MIKSLHIQNFQSHTDTTVEFSEGVTAFVGLNNHGKSAIFRALEKVIRNEPEGLTFVTDGAKESVISVETDTGIVVRKVKTTLTSDNNMYLVNGLEFAKFGSVVPEEVIQVLPVSPVQEFGGVEFDLNFQHQLDPLFLVVGTGLPSIRGKVLGKITGVHVVNRAIQLAALEDKRTNQEITRVQSRQESLEQELEKYLQVEGLLKTSAIVKQLLQSASLLQTQALQLTSHLKNLRAIVTQANAQVKMAKALDRDFSEIQTTLTTLFSAVEKVRKLQDLQRQIQSCKSASEIEVPEKLVSSSFERLEKLKAVQRRLYECSNSRTQAIREVQKAETDFAEADTELHQLRDQLGVCPVCERPFE